LWRWVFTLRTGVVAHRWMRTATGSALGRWWKTLRGFPPYELRNTPFLFVPALPMTTQFSTLRRPRQCPDVNANYSLQRTARTQEISIWYRNPSAPARDSRYSSGERS